MSAGGFAVLPHRGRTVAWRAQGATSPFGGCERACDIARNYAQGHGCSHSVFMRSADDVDGRLWIVAPASRRGEIEVLYGPVLWISTEECTAPTGLL